ncbi:hypothetical protein [Noviherbaspirillum soli]|uniref:hypothetical protein n=1 Tax=Noviherbaspirillum soli TaxID=1064518 RepID=UPI001889FD33|nr:hypothetical protein [Noviherbaspirillum soli]
MSSSLLSLPCRRSALSAAAVLTLFVSASASAATLQVGPGKTFSTPCRAFAAASDGDTIEIDAAGSYNGDVCGIGRSWLTIRGVNGRPKINANGANSMGKGIWVVQGTGTVIENVEMFGARVADRNGAALRLDGRDLTLRGSYLHDNENGILTNNDGVSNIIIENTEFASNGYGDGYSHNLYIGHVNSLVFRNSYSHDAKVGHNLKSRANTNTIVYSRFSSSINAPSYEIDLPNAGKAYVIGNVIQQPAWNNNPSLLAFGEEGASNVGQELYVVNNTFLNEDSSRGTFIMVGSGVTTPVLMQNNLFVGTGTASTQYNTVDRTNLRTLSAAFVDRAGYDLRPASGSPAINAGSAPGTSASGLSLTPTLQYKHVAGGEARPVNGAIDIGAYEAAAATTTTTTTPTTTTTTSPSTTSTVTNWIACAAENGTCSFSGTRQVRYGANGTYAYKSATDSISCSNAVFGDPVYGVAKSCSYADTTTSTTTTTAPTTTTTTTTAPSTQTWTRCATENGTCSFSGTHQVRYGANNIYSYKSATGAIACSNWEFGDPVYGVQKYCDYLN